MAPTPAKTKKGKAAKAASASAPSRTFAEASKQIQDNLQKHLARQRSSRQQSKEGGGGGEDDDYLSSSSTSSDQEDGGGDQQQSEEILQKVFGNYGSLGGSGGDASADARARQDVLNNLKSGLTSCLICISSLKKQEAVWSCRSCHCSFHMNCVQRWARDSLFQQKNEIENDPDPASARQRILVQWSCPKCREAYRPDQVPTRYTCYCKKLVDPPFDPWIVPHSCGDTCDRELSPKCGHRCLILCHPGRCPPCPKILTSPCHCGQSAPATRRCYDRTWSCGKPCGRTLNCGQHRCPLPCHDGDCQPCQKTSVQLCQCRRHQTERQCASPEWTCEEKCARPLKCGHHICDIVCHKDACPPCPLSEVRKCPCGKSSHMLPCTLATPTCGDTCGKTLSCGSHVCAERCHRGQCGSCLQVVLKQCRCATKKKEVPCTKDYLCDLKCKRLRDCRKHACNRKCCDGVNCNTCEQACNKTLTCRNHKCASRCHQGACYPCTQTKEVTCFCGSSRILVPCGLEKSTKPPKCKQKCAQPPDCRHPAREPHNCHFGPCRPCRQTCLQPMKCGHLCKSRCHDQVKVQLKPDKAAATPWEATGPRTEVRAVDCPDCQEPVAVTCLGQHETADWPCFAAKSGPCGRQCGRALPCGNHTCGRDCHRVKNAPSPVECGSNCRRCELPCQRERPPGCGHACSKPCHTDECEQCGHMMRVKCHCGLSQLYVKCGEWTTAKKEDKLKLACCNNQCPKNVECGHRCTKICHSDSCSDASVCRKRVKVYCPCKRKKEEMACGKRKDKLECDDECEMVKQKAREEREAEEREKREEEERRQREELERFEKNREGKKKRRNRRYQNDDDDAGDVNLLKKYKVIVVALSLLAVALATTIMLWK